MPRGGNRLLSTERNPVSAFRVIARPHATAESESRAEEARSRRQYKRKIGNAGESIIVFSRRTRRNDTNGTTRHDNK